LLASLGFAQAGTRADLDAYRAAIRDLDREQFLEDEPIWLCAPSGTAISDPARAIPRVCVIVGKDDQGRAVEKILAAPDGDLLEVPRGYELTTAFGFEDPTGRASLLGLHGGIPAGRWELHPSVGDTAHVLARFRVVAPNGSERSVRDGLARASRLSRSDPARAAALYEAIGRRYPRTTYLSALYWGEWLVRGHTRFAGVPEKWIEEIFAHFHDSCFGTIALDRWVRAKGEESARPTIRRLVGLYPDTPLSRAAARYL
jgi:hypothetical protein